jgi:hypothetical protein
MALPEAAGTLAPLAWRLSWDHGHAEVQALGAMLGPVTFRLDAERDLQVMHVAPWAGTVRSLQLPGLLRRLRGEWPCLPFGRVDTPPDLPPGWQALAAEDEWPHGYGANHHWRCEFASAQCVRLAIDYPATAPIERLERQVQVVPGQPALDIELVVYARRSVRLPAGLHATFHLPQPSRRVCIELGRHEGLHSYPSRSAGALTGLQPDSRGERLQAMPGSDGGTIDLSRVPLDDDREELLQVRGLAAEAGGPPLRLHYLDHDARAGLWWDTAQFPDLLLWFSNRGRPEFPWNSGHLALGAEPVHSVFDLGRVARPPAGHALADRQGIALEGGQAWRTRYRLGAWSGEQAPAALAP